MYLQRDPNRRYWVVDCEADGLEPTRIHCVVAEDLDTGEQISVIDYDDIRRFFDDEIARGSVFIGHNFLAWDSYWLNRLVGTRIPVGRIVDTLVLSMLYSPSLKGGHSLGAWGERVSIKKVDHDDWETFSEDMLVRCQTDVSINKQLYLRLSERMRSVGYSERSAEIETKAWANIQKQRRNGFAFDTERASILLAELREEERKLKETIYELWPPRLEEVRVYKRPFKRDGGYSEQYKRHIGEYPKVELTADGSGYKAYDYVEFNLGSPSQRVEKLLELGWKPRSFTPTGNPKVDEDSLVEFAQLSGRKEVSALAEWVVINARGNMVENWLNVQKEGFIHGNLWIANTLRYRHSDPNTANIPSIRRGPKPEERILKGREGFWTYETRDLWTTRDNATRSLVGVDAKGIQLRILAHYLGNKEYQHHVVSGDPHEYTRGITEVGSRPQNKNFIYAYLLGGGAAKLGLLLGISPKEGARVKDKFTNEFPGLQRLLNRIQGEVQRTGRLTLCSGARILVPEPRLALAYLLQGDESCIMKQAGIYLNGEVKENCDAIKVGDIHDEFQYDVADDDVGRFRGLCLRAFERSGRSFDYGVPIHAEVKVGKTWSETH